HGDQSPVVDEGQGGALHHRAEHVGAVDHGGAQHSDQRGQPGEFCHAAPPSAAWGSAPSCCRTCNVLSSSQCSTNMPSATRQMSMERISTRRSVAGIPMNSPECVPRYTKRPTTRSPETTRSSMVAVRSGNAAKNPVQNCRLASRPSSTKKL